MTEKNLLRMCCECKKINIDENWVGKEQYPNYQSKIDSFGEKITHGYCPVCFETTMKEIKELKKNKCR
jgi:hypothetical protein